MKLYFQGWHFIFIQHDLLVAAEELTYPPKNINAGHKKGPAIAGPLFHVRDYDSGVVMLFFFLSLMVEIQATASDGSEKYEQPQHA